METECKSNANGKSSCIENRTNSLENWKLNTQKHNLYRNNKLKISRTTIANFVESKVDHFPIFSTNQATRWLTVG
jgi:hypothetical protein